MYAPSATSDQEANDLLRGLNGRDFFAPRLREWLERHSQFFTEPIVAMVLDGIADHGLDVILQGQRSQLKIGFQIKTDNDLKARDFAQRLRAQMFSAQDYGAELVVLVFACRPTKQNQQKYKPWLAQTIYLPNQRVLALAPERAAGLLKCFSSSEPLPRPLREVTWDGFFAAVGHPELMSRYVDSWPELEPDQRFLPPSEYDSIRQSVEENRLTIVTGPPAVGKTFLALQLLWQAYQQGRPVHWIGPERLEPTSGPIAVEEGAWTSPTFGQRVDRLVRRLGWQDGRPPLDEHEFVSRFFQPDALVYIEDPFGRTAAEFDHSLHTYQFFDLDRFVQALETSSARAGCRLLLTSRENLFQRWLADRASQGQSMPSYRVLSISTASYRFEELFDHVALLARTRGAVDPLAVARGVTRKIETPYEAGLLVGKLPPEAGEEEAAALVEGRRGDLRSTVASLLAPGSDADCLLLLLVAAITGRERTRDLAPFYLALHCYLELPGDAETDLQTGLAHFATCLTISGRQPDSPRLPAKMEANHSVIREQIESQLEAVEIRPLLNRVAIALGQVGELARPRQEGPGLDLSILLMGDGWSAHEAVALFLLNLGVGRETPEVEKVLSSVIFERVKLDSENVSKLVRFWPKLPATFKSRLAEELARGEPHLVATALGYLPESGVDPPETWPLYDLLLDPSRRPKSRWSIVGSYCWNYLFKHLAAVPETLLSKLDDWAQSEPRSYLRALGEHLVIRWALLPLAIDRKLLWRAPFFLDVCLHDEEAQHTLASTIARCWDLVPQTLRELFDSQLRSTKVEIRAIYAGRAAFWADEEPALACWAHQAVEDPELKVPLEAFRWAREGEVRQRLGRCLLARKEPGAAIELLEALLDDRDPWTAADRELAETARLQAGAVGEAFLAYRYLEGERETRQLDHQPAATTLAEPEPVRAAWIWAFLNGAERAKVLSEDEVSVLVRSLAEPRARGWTLFYLSVRWQVLSPTLQQLVEQLDRGPTDDREAIAEGVKRRGHAGQTPKWPFLAASLLESA